ncbi:Ctr copper transporter family-domain-containing protein [Podospora aff. communis PSN243]|uniref:Copper transport protein n=1 Tax=Podospora aff. communis PSN243 TaxID=3040156 RepID=A0AAV9G508_9PEZI|nr:Ctr copper transporter family-domain-containing protein [Podospora aff. communis PSN243]
MDHSGHSMPSTTTSAVAAAATAAMGGHGDMDHGMGNGCKISMLWNWYTVDACFLSSTWHIRSAGMFAGSCIGVILLVMLLELLRRSVKEYDRYIIRKHLARQAATVTSDSADILPKDLVCSARGGYKPTLLEQAVRALLHTCQFAVAYFVMLLAMYYNGYIIICIFIGAYIGSFVFQWEEFGAGSQTTAAREATVCCG